MAYDPSLLGKEQIVSVEAGRVSLFGNLTIPQQPKGLVLFAHGSGSSRHSRRNRYVAESFQQAALGTLLIDLLTAEEERIDERTRQHRFDIPLLADRLLGTLRWLRERPETEALHVGLFGASTGGGAALMAAAQDPGHAAAVVSRGGRPDLAGEWLPKVQCPTLLIVGSRDETVLELNQQALDQLDRAAERELAIVAGATHLFEEPGALDEVAGLATDWFLRYLIDPAFTGVTVKSTELE